MSEESSKAPQIVRDQDVEIVSNLTGAPAFAVDGAQGQVTVNGITRINLYQVMQDFGASDDVGLKKVVVARLYMSPDTAVSIARWILQSLGQDEKKEE